MQSDNPYATGVSGDQADRGKASARFRKLRTSLLEVIVISWMCVSVMSAIGLALVARSPFAAFFGFVIGMVVAFPVHAWVFAFACFLQACFRRPIPVHFLTVCCGLFCGAGFGLLAHGFAQSTGSGLPDIEVVAILSSVVGAMSVPGLVELVVRIMKMSAEQNADD